MNTQLWREMVRRSFNPRQWFDEGESPGRTDTGHSGPDMEETMMWVYRRSEENCWTVGYYAPDKSWNPESDHQTKEEAAARVHYLNGGGQPRPDVVRSARAGYSGT